MTEGWWIFFAGLIVTGSAWWFSRVYAYAKDLNEHRLVILEHVNETAIQLTERYIADSDAAVKVLRILDMKEFNRLSRTTRLEQLPMLNSSILKGYPPHLLKDVIRKTTTITSMYNYIGALDYMMKQTTGSVIQNFVEAASKHFRTRKDETFLTDEEDFRNCQTIENKRNQAIRTIKNRKERAELNLTFLKGFRDEITGDHKDWFWWYFRHSIF